MGQLEVSRSIGDGPYKNHGVSCVPDVKRCQLMENDRYTVIPLNSASKCAEEFGPLIGINNYPGAE